MDTKQRGRKAGVGTVEAREFISSGKLDNLLTNFKNNLSNEARARIIKAIRFGLGIKKEEV